MQSQLPTPSTGCFSLRVCNVNFTKLSIEPLDCSILKQRGRNDSSHESVFTGEVLPPVARSIALQNSRVLASGDLTGAFTITDSRGVNAAVINPDLPTAILTTDWRGADAVTIN